MIMKLLDIESIMSSITDKRDTDIIHLNPYLTDTPFKAITSDLMIKKHEVKSYLERINTLIIELYKNNYTEEDLRQSTLKLRFPLDEFKVYLNEEIVALESNLSGSRELIVLYKSLLED